MGDGIKEKLDDYGNVMASVVEGLQKKIDELKEVIKDKDKDIGRVLKKLCLSQEQNLVLQEMLSKQSETATAGNKIKQQIREMAELRTQNNTYAASLKAAERKIENLEARLEQREEELNEARDKLANTMETVLDLKDDMKQMKDKKEAVENQIEEKEKELERVESDNKQKANKLLAFVRDTFGVGQREFAADNGVMRPSKQDEPRTGCESNEACLETSRGLKSHLETSKSKIVKAKSIDIGIFRLKLAT